MPVAMKLKHHVDIERSGSRVSSNLLGFRTLQILRFQHLCCVDLLLVHAVQGCWQSITRMLLEAKKNRFSSYLLSVADTIKVQHTGFSDL